MPQTREQIRAFLRKEQFIRYVLPLVVGLILFQVTTPSRALMQPVLTGVDCVHATVNGVDNGIDCEGIWGWEDDGGGGGPGTGPVGVGGHGGGSPHTPANTQPTANLNNSQNPKSNDCDKKTPTANAVAQGDPIDTSSGSKIEEVTDFAEPGEMGLTFVRYYNSRYTCAGSSTCMTSMGAWTTNLDYHLFLSCTYSTTGPATTSAAIKPDQLPGGGEPVPCGPAYYYRPDGSTLPFPSTNAFYGTAGSTVDLPGPFNSAGTATLTNNGNGTYTVHDEDTRNLTFNAQGVLQSITDAAGISWTLTYPNANTVVVTHTNGQSFTLQRNSSPTTYGTAKQISVTDPAGNVYTYQSTTGVIDATLEPVSQIGVIDSVTLPGSPSTVVGYQYFPDNTTVGAGTYAQLKEVDYNGVAHDLTTYDSSGRANMTSLADGTEKTSVVYGSNSTGVTATVTNPLGHVSVYQYNSSNLLVSVTGDASSHCAATFSQNTYDANGNLLTSTDNNGNVTAYTYAATGLLQKEIEGQGSAVQRTTDIAWDPTAGTVRPLSTTIEGYAKTAYTYDAHNRLASVAVTNLTSNGTASQTLTTSYTHALYSNGLVQTKTVVHPSPNNSNTDTYTYDTQGHLTSVANGLGQTTTYSNYTALGQPQKVVGPNGDETDYTYDARNRVSTKTTHPNGTTATWTYGYDGFGLLATQTEPDGVVTQWNRDAEMRVTSITHTEKDGNSTETIGYDANGDVTSDVITRGGVTALSESMSYDELGRLIEKDGANGQKQTYQYDLDGNLVSTTNAVGHTIAYQYDALNRLSQTAESGGASLTAPTLSVPLSSATGSYTVSWAATSDTTSYTLQEQVNGGAWSTIYTGSNTSWGLSGKSDDSYGYQVEACNAGGCSGWSATASISVLLPPPAPASLTVPATSGASVAVSWPSSSTATSYTLQQALNGGAWSTVYSGAALAYTATETTSGSYTFRIQACNASGCGAYTTSSAVAVTVPPSTAPSLSVPATNNNGSYTVSWVTVSGAASYALQEQVNGGSWSTIYSGASTSEARSGKGNGSYGYQVQACNAGGCGPWSAVSSVTVTFPPSAPASVSVPSTSSGSVAVSWPSASTATSYTLQQAVNGGAWSTIYSGAALAYTATETATGSYTFHVQACNVGGCSGYTTSGNVAVTIPPSTAPSLSVPATNGSGSYTVSWGTVSGATTYYLHEQVNGGSWSTVYGGSGTSLALGGKANGSNYGYQVQACNAGGCGPWSATQTVSVLWPPAAPTSLSVVTPEHYPGPNWVLSWPAVTAASSYTVAQTTVGSGTWSSGNSVTGTSTTAYGTPGTYQYRVQACNASGCSGWTTSQKVTVVCNEQSAVAAKANGVQPLVLKCN